MPRGLLLLRRTGDPQCGTEDQCLVTVTATDSAGDPGGTDRVQINVQIEIINVNELPVITGDNAVSVDENLQRIWTPRRGGWILPVNRITAATDAETADTSLVWTLSGTDADFFSFTDATTLTVTAAEPLTLRFKEAPDFEDPKDANKDNTYEVTLNVSDGTGATTKEVKVTVKNRLTVDGTPGGTEDEPGTVTLSHIQPRVGVALVATLKDDDGGIRSQSWQWSISGATGAASTPAGDIAGPRRRATPRRPAMLEAL